MSQENATPQGPLSTHGACAAGSELARATGRSRLLDGASGW